MTLMNTRRKLYLTAVVLTLAGAMALWAQGTPIIIGDGSLTMESQGVPWPNYSTSGNTKSHPRAGQTVTQVAITMPNNNQTIPFSGQQCTITVTYAGTTIKVDTNPQGKALTVNTDFTGSFHQGANNTILAHNNTTAKISHVTVTKAGQQVFDSGASGGTRIVISYQ
jgi:hypothetical protein